MVIRLAQEGDHPFLVREYLQHYSPNMVEAERYALLHLQVDRALLLEENGFILGLATWGAREGIRNGLAQLTGIRLITTRRRQGLGRELFLAVLRDMEDYYASRDAVLRRLFLFSPEEAGPFFEKMGFAKAAVLHDHREVKQSDVLYLLDL
jgi:N-acetylglutamate synthase-like GNAT family acetyltransferase